MDVSISGLPADSYLPYESYSNRNFQTSKSVERTVSSNAIRLPLELNRFLRRKYYQKQQHVITGYYRSNILVSAALVAVTANNTGMSA
jgi:hypothetical protein